MELLINASGRIEDGARFWEEVDNVRRLPVG